MNKKVVASNAHQSNNTKESLIETKKYVSFMLDIIGFDSKKIDEALDKNNLWDVALALGDRCNDPHVSKDEITSLNTLITTIRETMGKLARHNTDPTTVVFGTSGWRGKIGEDFTILNVHKVTRGIIEMMKSDVFLKTNGYNNFQDVQDKGILVFRDNRYMGNDFMEAAMKELAQAGITVYTSGECPTGVGSALVTELGVAGSINFTPSHNDMTYAGLKFNPGDGGPADQDLTNLIMKESETYMVSDAAFTRSTSIYTAEKVDAAQIYMDYIQKQFKTGNGLFDLASLWKFLLDKKDEVYLVIDNMHGSSKGFIEKIIGDDLVEQLKSAGAIDFVNTNEDYSFHGVKPEPNENNQKILIEMATRKVKLEPKRWMTLGVAFDPDADRIRFCTANADINMNTFGAIAYGHLLKKGITGPIATTLPSSKFAVAMAQKYKQKIYEVLVGFKWFRPLFDALVKYEESDGISFRGHTLEKDGIAGFLMALQIMKDQNKDIFSFFKDLQKEFGYYYAKQSPREVKDIKIDPWKKLRKDVERDLQSIYGNVTQFRIDGVNKNVRSTRTDDGIMIVFEDNSWLLVRSSGTEPKFRVYYEITSQTELTNEEIMATQKSYANAGLTILNQALAPYGW